MKPEPLNTNQQNENILIKWRHLYSKELDNVDDVILNMSQNDVPLIPQLVKHIISSGGKRLRPIMTILSAKLCGYEGERHIKLAACIEFIHTATLLHDDVVDESDLRRGSPTANNIWGNAASVLVGDYLLSKAFQIMAQDGSLKILEILSNTSSIITEGEVKQLSAINNIQTDEATYIDIISRKTAQLFAAACRVGAVIAEQSNDKEEALEEFGKHLGIAFQITDDALDYCAKQEELGKTIGDDFREGKVTLPVIIAYKKSNEDEKEFWKNAIKGKERNIEQLEEAISIINKYNAIDETMLVAEKHRDIANRVISTFPDSELRQILKDISDFSVYRSY